MRAPLLSALTLLAAAAPLLWACVLVYVGNATSLQSLDVSQSIAASGPIGTGTLHHATAASEAAP